MSGKEENLIKQAKRMGQPIPDRIKNKPILKTYLALYYDAFLTLQYDRNGNERIPWTVIVKYVDRNELDKIQEENLEYFIRRLDECYAKWIKNKKG